VIAVIGPPSVRSQSLSEIHYSEVAKTKIRSGWLINWH